MTTLDGFRELLGYTRASAADWGGGLAIPVQAQQIGEAAAHSQRPQIYTATSPNHTSV
jgi:hypothetical protein